MNNYIQKIVEDFDFNNVRDNNDKAGSFAENILGVVDLGMPSGTLWCKCNLGANFEYEYGDYYAWGELTTKDEYIAENYTFTDKPNQLTPECDIATQTLGDHYSIPTKEQFYELIRYTNNYWIKNYNGTGVKGRLFTSKINDNSIFIPAAGYINSRPNDIGLSGFVWSSSIYTTRKYNAWRLYFGSGSGNTFMSYPDRYFGQSVRPVFKK